MLAIVRIVDGLPPMTVMVEASEWLAARENPTRQRTGTIARIVTENARKKERRSLHGWTHTSLLLAATVWVVPPETWMVYRRSSERSRRESRRSKVLCKMMIAVVTLKGKRIRPSLTWTKFSCSS
jgi:hypothetical protein